VAPSEQPEAGFQLPLSHAPIVMRSRCCCRRAEASWSEAWTTPSRVLVARPARSPRRLVGHAAAAQTRRVQPASLLQAHLQVRRSTRCLGQLYKSGFTELCDVIMRTNETPLAAATHKLNQLKDKAGLSDAPADDSGRPRGRICG